MGSALHTQGSQNISNDINKYNIFFEVQYSWKLKLKPRKKKKKVNANAIHRRKISNYLVIFQTGDTTSFPATLTYNHDETLQRLAVVGRCIRTC